MIEWFIIITPLVFGIGSVAAINVVHTSGQDDSHGIIKAMPSLLATHLVYLIYTLVLGFTFGWIIVKFAVPSNIIKYVGAALLFVLAYKLWIREKKISAENYLTIGEECLVQAFKPAIPLIVIIMFSVFLDVTKPLGLQVSAMAIGLIIISLVTQAFWVFAGMLLNEDLFSDSGLINLERGFAIFYVLLALWVII